MRIWTDDPNGLSTNLAAINLPNVGTQANPLGTLWATTINATNIVGDTTLAFNNYLGAISSTGTTLDLLKGDATDNTVLNAATGKLIKLAFNGTTDVSLAAGSMTFAAASYEIIPGATSLLFRNNADSATNLSITDAGLVTARAGLVATTGGVTATAGGLTATAGGLTVVAGGATITSGDVLVSGGGIFQATNTRSIISGATSVPAALLSIGGTAPGLYIEKTGGIDAAHLLYYAADTASPTVRFFKTRAATPVATTIVASGDELARINFRGADGVNFVSGATILVTVDDTPGVGDMPGALDVQLSPNGSSTPVSVVKWKNNALMQVPTTVTAGGTTGNQTIDKPSGTVNFAVGASSLVVTNALVTANSLVFAVVRTNDATAVLKNVVPGAGSFTITLDAATTAETSVGFWVVN